MTVFLSYSRRDERLVADTAALLSAAGVETRRFEFIEYLGEQARAPVHCNANIVFYSQRSRITDAVRLSHYLARRHYQKLLLIDESWDPDPQATIVFSALPRERLAFEPNTILARLKTLFRALHIISTPSLSGPTPRDADAGDKPALEHFLTTAEFMSGGRLSRKVRRPSLKQIAAAAPPALFKSGSSNPAQPSLRALLQKNQRFDET